jgi:hypothetical protein
MSFWRRKAYLREFFYRRLLCSLLKMAMQASGPPDSCQALLLVGHTVPGYYIVDVPGGENYKVVHCNFPAGPSDSQFQVDTEVMFAEFPVAFSFSRGVLKTPGVVINYNQRIVNEGNAMTYSGTFTAPLDGIYSFSFFLDEPASMGADTIVHLQLEGKSIDSIYVQDGHNSMSGKTVVRRLSKGQQVRVFLKKGAVGGSAPNVFSGHLLFPL